jgi:hypothetical protein
MPVALIRLAASQLHDARVGFLSDFENALVAALPEPRKGSSRV